MIATECAAPPDSIDVEWFIMAECYARGLSVPPVVWCAPETDAERRYVDRWGAHDWPAADVALAQLDDGVLWLRADRPNELTHAILTLISRTN